MPFTTHESQLEDLIMTNTCYATSSGSNGSRRALTACVRDDDASAWHVRQIAGGQWRWVAWSDWTRFNRGMAPEVAGLADDQNAAVELAMGAARSMNPVRSLQVFASQPQAVRQAV